MFEFGGAGLGGRGRRTRLKRGYCAGFALPLKAAEGTGGALDSRPPFDPAVTYMSNYCGDFFLGACLAPRWVSPSLVLMSAKKSLALNG